MTGAPTNPNRARAPVTDWATDFDHRDPRWAEDPHAIWRELRQRCPVAHTNRYEGVYLPVRYADIRAVAYDPEHFSSRRITIRVRDEPLRPAPPVTSDPPVHRDDRKILLAPFSPQAVAKVEPRARAICRELLQRLHDHTTCDATEDYARGISTGVIGTMLGLPEQEGPRFRRWTRDVLEDDNPDSVVQAAMAEMDAFFNAEIARKRAAPGDDIIGHLLKAELNGRPLSAEHVARTIQVLLFAGIETTWSVIAASLLHLATHPDDRKRLVAEPSLIPTAVEEFLRAFAPASVAREIVKDTEIGGCPVKQGEMVILAFGAANRDPAVFPDADRVIIDRAENQHATFGLGIHRCIGANLARMEIQIALEEWLGAFPDFELQPGAIVSWTTGVVRGPRQVPLTLRV
jgi:cytochrome P450